jgi:hypothetical protein
METVKELKRLLRKLLWKIAGWPKRVTWHDPAQVSLEVEGDTLVIALCVSNLSRTPQRVALRYSRLAIEREGQIEKLEPLRAQPAAYFVGETLGRGETLTSKIYFERRDHDAACFAVILGRTLFEFPIAPAQSSGSTEGRI